MKAHPPVVLNLGRWPRSIHYRPYLESITPGRNLIEWWCEWFVSHYPDSVLWLLTNDSCSSPLLSRLVLDGHVVILDSNGDFESQVILQRVQECQCGRLARVPLGLPFGPADLLKRTTEHHAESGLDFTAVRNLPKGCAPIVLSKLFLDILAGLPMEALAPDLRLSAESFLKANRAVDENSRTEVKQGSLDAVAIYNVSIESLPEAVSLSSPEDIDVARAVLQSCNSPAPGFSGMSGLMRWKSLVVGRAKDRMTPRPQCSGHHHQIRVMYISTASAFSGAEESLSSAIERLPRDRFNQHALVGSNGRFTDRLRQAGVNVECPNSDFSRATIRNHDYLRNVIRNVSPDVIHLNGLESFPVLMAAYDSGARIVQHVRIADCAAMKEQILAATRVLAVSEFVKKQIGRLDVDAGNVAVLYDGVDEERFAPGTIEREQARRRLEIDPQVLLVTMVARFAPNKRHDLAFKAIARTRAAIPNTMLLLVGEVHEDPGCYAQAMKHIRALALDEAVRHVNFMEDVRFAEAAANVVVLCSDREPLGTSVLESLALGVPVVITRSGGLAELVEDGETGLVVPPGDFSKLADALIRLLTDDGLARKLGLNGRTLIETSLTSGDCARIFARSLEESLN